jgi:hypothetical protein
MLSDRYSVVYEETIIIISMICLGKPSIPVRRLQVSGFGQFDAATSVDMAKNK